MNAVLQQKRTRGKKANDNSSLSKPGGLNQIFSDDSDSSVISEEDTYDSQGAIEVSGNKSNLTPTRRGR